MSKYTRADDWAEAKNDFKKTIGNPAWEMVEDLFGDIDEAIIALDEGILSWVEAAQKQKEDITSDPIEIQRDIDHAKSRMGDLRGNFAEAEDELEKELKENLPRTNENDEALEDLLGELNATEKFVLLTYNQGISILTGKKVKKKEVKEEISRLAGKLERTKFLADGQWSVVMANANEKIKIVQRLLKTYSELPEVVQAEAENIRDVIAQYNTNLPNAGTGVRSVTTYMKGFLEMEYIFAAVDKKSSSLVKTLVPGKKIKSYDDYRRFLKVAGRAIKVLSPWANGASALDPNDYITKAPNEILDELRQQLLQCKKLLSKLNSIFSRFD